MKINLFSVQILLVIVFTLLLPNLFSSTFPVNAQLNPITNQFLEILHINYKRVTASPGEDAPSGRRHGAGSQVVNASPEALPPPDELILRGGSHSGNCTIEEYQTHQPLIAVVPKETTIDGDSTAIWGKTTKLSPTLWFYVAYPQKTNVMFELHDQAAILYSHSFELQSKTPGLVSVTIPSTMEMTLAAGKKYFWYFDIMCSQSDFPDDFVSGWVEVAQVNPEFAYQLNQATPLQKVKMYAENGFWYDTLSELKQLRSQQPDNKQLDNIWTDLLQQIGFSDEFIQATITSLQMR